MKIKCPECSTAYEIKAEALGSEGRSVKCAKCGNRWFASPKIADDVSPGLNPSGSDSDENASLDAQDTDNDQADWQADAEDETRNADAVEDDPETRDEPDDIEDFSPPAATSRASTDEERYASDLADEENEDKDRAGDDIESRAKRPRITVNPNKFRRNHISAVLLWVMRRNFRRIGGVTLFGLAIAACASFVLMRDDIVKRSPDLASLFQMIGFDVNLRGLEFRNLRTFTEVEDGRRVLVVEGSIRNLLDEGNGVPAVRLSIRDSDLQEVYAWTVEPRTKSLNGFDETRFRTILADPPKTASDIQVRFIDRDQRQIVLE